MSKRETKYTSDERLVAFGIGLLWIESIHAVLSPKLASKVIDEFNRRAYKKGKPKSKRNPKKAK